MIETASTESEIRNLKCKDKCPDIVWFDRPFHKIGWPFNSRMGNGRYRQRGKGRQTCALIEKPSIDLQAQSIEKSNKRSFWAAILAMQNRYFVGHNMAELHGKWPMAA